MDYVYIFGAGASAGKHSSYGRDSWLMDPQYKLVPSNRIVQYDQVLPTIYRIADRVEAMSKRLESLIMSSHFNPDDADKIKTVSKQLHDLSWYLNRESYPDIYAETLYMINKQKYNEFIKIFNLYLIIEQMCSGVDQRYKVFFTNLIQRSEQKLLPSNIKIFSWNYDYQMEEAFYEKRSLVGHFDQFMNNVLLNPLDFTKITTDFVSVKLNGYAPKLKHNNHDNLKDETMNCISSSNPIYFNIDEEGRRNRTHAIGKKIVELFDYLFIDSYNPSLRFAWQIDSANEIIQSLKKLKGSITTKEIMIIGYSFPALNTKIDTALLNIFRPPFKVYLQVYKEDFETIKARVMAILKSISGEEREIVFIDPNQDFFIPFNLLRQLK